MTTEASNSTAERVVVGVDGSGHSRAALAWGARQAELTGASLTVVTTWELPTSYGYVAAWPENVDFEADARAVLEETVETVLGPDSSLEITRRVERGHAALVLVEESRRAAVVVVGCRGHGEFTGMLIGSVSEHLATHAHCPVVIVRGQH